MCAWGKIIDESKFESLISKQINVVQTNNIDDYKNNLIKLTTL